MYTRRVSHFIVSPSFGNGCQHYVSFSWPRGLGTSVSGGDPKAVAARAPLVAGSGGVGTRQRRVVVVIVVF